MVPLSVAGDDSADSEIRLLALHSLFSLITWTSALVHKEGAVVLKSLAFAEGGMIPQKYTCDGADVSPPLSWTGVPEGTRSFVLICDDPDAPSGTWVHWVLYDLPATVRELPEQVPTDREPDVGGRQGTTDFRRIGYGGPCPPGGTHRYFFKLYALDRTLGLPAGPTKKRVEEAMKGHTLAEAQLMGRYSR